MPSRSGRHHHPGVIPPFPEGSFLCYTAGLEFQFPKRNAFSQQNIIQSGSVERRGTMPLVLRKASISGKDTVE